MEECVNTGIPSDRKNKKKDIIFLKNQPSIIPLFHYSMVEAKKFISKNTLYFHTVVEISKR
jgi:hypothetical protein